MKLRAIEALDAHLRDVEQRLTALEQSTACAERSAPGAQSDADKGASGALNRDGGPCAADRLGDTDMDDSAAVTFWGKRDLRDVLRKALAALDTHYDALATGRKG